MCAMHRTRARVGIPLDQPVQRQATRAEIAAAMPQMRAMREGGATYRQIAATVGIGVAAVSRALRRAGVQAPRVIPHGTPSGWQHHRCRCEICLIARREYKRAERAARMARPATAPHGTSLAYRQGCRCDQCAAMSGEETRRRQARTRPTARRSGARWTGADAEIAMREDLTIEEKAVMMGRTFAAVDDWLRAYERRPDDPFGVKRT